VRRVATDGPFCHMAPIWRCDAGALMVRSTTVPSLVMAGGSTAIPRPAPTRPRKVRDIFTFDGQLRYESRGDLMERLGA
jgi:hypothetical protein